MASPCTKCVAFPREFQKFDGGRIFILYELKFSAKRKLYKPTGMSLVSVITFKIFFFLAKYKKQFAKRSGNDANKEK